MAEESPMVSQKVAFVTPSFAPDCDIATDLCRSIDKYFQSEFDHYILVPTRDIPTFSHLKSHNRHILSSEKHMRQYGLYRVPSPTRLRIPGLFERRLNTNWFKRGFGRIGGWSVQQMIKLSAPAITDCENIVCLDSDLLFIKPVTSEIFYKDGCLRLHRGSGPLASSKHEIWRTQALDMLGIDPAQTLERSYIGNLVTWRRSNIIALQEYISERHNKDWIDLLCRAKDFSEYMIYGYFCEYVLPDHGLQTVEPFDRVHSLWTLGNNDKQKFFSGFEQKHVAVHIQSTISKNARQRRIMINDVMKRIEGQQFNP